MLNQSIFSNQLYGLLIKNLRQTHQLSLTDLSKKVYLNPSTISRLETNPNSSYDKYESIFTYFNIDRKFIDKAENELSSAFIQFMQAIIDISPDVTKCYLNLQNNFKEYKNSIFSFIFDLSDFIYSYFNLDYITLDYQSFLNSIDLLSDEYQAYAYIYIAQYLTKQGNFDNVLSFFEQAKIKSTYSIQATAFLSYFLSSFYLKTNDYINSLKEIEKSANLFLELQNYNRLINLNIKKGNQLRYIHLYQKALDNDLSTLSKINDYPHLNIEKYAILNNIAWTYLLMEDYKNALYYLKQISIKRKTNNHFFDEAVCNIMLGNDNEALRICIQEIKTTSNKQMDYVLLKWLKEFLNDKQNKQLLIKYKKFYNQYKHQLSNLDREYYLKLLMHFYIEQKSYKNATNIALEIMKINN